MRLVLPGLAGYAPFLRLVSAPLLFSSTSVRKRNIFPTRLLLVMLTHVNDSLSQLGASAYSLNLD